MSHPLSSLEGKYELLGKLHEGGMGAIYKVRHRLLEEIRVVKVLHPQLATDESFQSRFVQEARAAVRVRHPNIAHLYDFSVDDEGRAFMVMEFIEGLNLAEVLAIESPLPPDLVAEIGLQALDALRYLHKQNFVHRDIAPDNLMLTRDDLDRPSVQLIDLGIVKALEEDAEITQAGMFVGKVRYASPEHFGGLDGRTQVEPRSDLYSLGVLLYELVTGWLPIVGKDYSSILAGHLFRPPLSFEETDPKNRVTESLREVLLKALRKKPEDRFLSAEHFSTALGRAADGTASDLGLAWERISPRLDDEPADSSRKPGSTQQHLDEEFPQTGPGQPETILPSESGSVVDNTMVLRTLEQTENRLGQLLDDDLLDQTEVILNTAEKNFGLPAVSVFRERLEQARVRLEVGPKIDQLRQEAYSLGLEHRFEEALDRLEQALELDPEHEEVKALLRHSHFAWEQQQRREKSAEYLDRAREALDGSHPNEAHILLEKAVELDPEGLEAAALLQETALSLERQQELRLATINDSLRLAELSISQKSLQVARSNLDLARHEIEALDHPAELAERVLAIEQAIRTEELVRGELSTFEDLVREGRGPEAKRLVEQTEGRLELESAKQDFHQRAAEVWLGRARGELMVGRFDDSTLALQEAIELAPDLFGAEALREQIEHHRQEADQDRKRLEVAEGLQKIEATLRGGDLSGASDLIEANQKRFGELPELDAFRARLIEEVVRAAEKRRQSEQIELMQEVDALTASGDLQGAVRRLEGLDPETFEATRIVGLRSRLCDRLLASAEQEISRPASGDCERLLQAAKSLSPTPHAIDPLLKQARRHRRQEEAAEQRRLKARDARITIEQRLEVGDFEGADFVLALAEKQLREGPEVEALRELVEGERREARERVEQKSATLLSLLQTALSKPERSSLEALVGEIEQARSELGDQQEWLEIKAELAEAFVGLARDHLQRAEIAKGLEILHRARDLAPSTGGIDALIHAVERSREELAHHKRQGKDSSRSRPAGKSSGIKKSKAHHRKDLDPEQLLEETLSETIAKVASKPKKMKRDLDPEELLARHLDPGKGQKKS